jgi:hypothetical protein
MSEDSLTSLLHTSINQARAHRWILWSSLIFAFGSFFFLLVSFKTAILDSTYDNIGQAAGYCTYTIGYFIYFVSEKNNNKKYLYIFSTITFIMASIIFLWLSCMTIYNTHDYGLDNICNLLGNLAWLVGYSVSFRGELLSPTKNNLNQLTTGLVQHHSVV